MIEAHAEVVRSAGDARKQALDRRTQRAKELVAVWQEFDETLRTNPWVAASNIVFRSFKVNDVQLSHALWFAGNPSTTELPPLLLQAEDAKRLTLTQRVRMAPVRVAWFDRYAPLLSDPARRLLAYEEAQRFRGLELRTHEFEADTVSYLNASDWRTLQQEGSLERLRGKMESAAISAASLRFYSLSEGKLRPYAEVLELRYAAAAGTAKDAARPARSIALTNALASYDLREPSYASY
jgi:hypothetical protein